MKNACAIPNQCTTGDCLHLSKPASSTHVYFPRQQWYCLTDKEPTSYRNEFGAIAWTCRRHIHYLGGNQYIGIREIKSIFVIFFIRAFVNRTSSYGLLHLLGWGFVVITWRPVLRSRNFRQDVDIVSGDEEWTLLWPMLEGLSYARFVTSWVLLRCG